MYYVLFHYTKGQKERDFRSFRHEDEVINCSLCQLKRKSTVEKK